MSGLKFGSQLVKRIVEIQRKEHIKIQYNRLREKLGWRRLTKLKLVSLQEAFNELATDKMRQDCKALLSDMFKKSNRKMN